MSNQYRLFQHRSGYFYHRVKVPYDIRDLYGKEIEQRSLHTRDYRDAVRRLPAVIVEVNQVFTQFRTDHADVLILVDQGSSSGAGQGTHRSRLDRLVSNFGDVIEAEEVERRSEAFRAASADLQSFANAAALPEAFEAVVSRDLRMQDRDAVLMLAHRVYLEKRISAIERASLIGDLRRWECLLGDMATWRHGAISGICPALAAST